MIFVSGNVIGSYRAQNVLKLLSDNNLRYSMLPIYLTIGSNRTIKLLSGLLSLLLLFPARLLLLLRCNTLIVLPMNNNKYTLLDVAIGRLLGKKIVLEFYISVFDTVVNDRKNIKPSSFQAKKISYIEKSLTRLATHIVCLNQAEAEYYRKFMHSGAESKIRVIPLVVDRVQPRTGQRNNSDREFNICWWGTYIPLHGLDKIIEAISLIEKNSVKLYIFGDLENKSTPYRNLVEKYNIVDSVIFNHEFTFKNGKLPDFLIKNCDLALGNFGTSDKATTVLVNKVVDTAALGIPCLTMETLGSLEFFESDKDIIYTKPSPSSKDIANSIIKIISGEYDLDDITHNTFKVYSSSFSPEAFSNKYLELIHNE